MQPLEKQKLNCKISRKEIKEAKAAMQTYMLESVQMGASFDNPVSPFKPNEEYEVGDLDIICNRFRMNRRLNNGPIMVSNDERLSKSTVLITTSTFNSLIRIMLSRSFESSEDFIVQALDEMPDGMPMSSFENLIIPVFCTVGMKKNFKKGLFQYDDSAGHFITLYLEMNSSRVSIYDHLNHDLTDSPFFDFNTIARALQAIHDHYQSQSKKALIFDQRIVQKQSSVDCGPHCLTNIELLLHKHDPSNVSFDRQTMLNIRYYHFLLKELMLSEFRLDLN